MNEFLIEDLVAHHSTDLSAYVCLKVQFKVSKKQAKQIAIQSQLSVKSTSNEF